MALGRVNIWGNALAVAFLPLLFAPFVSMSIFNVSFSEAMKVFRGWRTIVPLLGVSLAVFVDYLALSFILKPLREKGGDSSLDRLKFPVFSLIILAILGLLFLPTPLTRLIMMIKYS